MYTVFFSGEAYILVGEVCILAQGGGLYSGGGGSRIFGEGGIWGGGMGGVVLYTAFFGAPLYSSDRNMG